MSGCFYFVMVLAVALSVSTYVCLDPFSMTYIIQVASSVAVVVGVATGGHRRRIKNWIQEKFSIDENAEKEVEEDVVEFTDENVNCLERP